jgi:hypothetical protein
VTKTASKQQEMKQVQHSHLHPPEQRQKETKQSKSFLVPQQVSEVMSSESGDCKVSTKPEKRGSNKQKANLNSDTSQKLCHRDEAKNKNKTPTKQTENCAPKTQKK